METIEQGKLFQDEGYEKHVIKTGRECLHWIRSNYLVVLGNYRLREPDLFVRDRHDGPNIELIDVKTLNEVTRNLTIQRPMFDYNAEEYAELTYAIWADAGRLALTHDELLERQVQYRLGGNVHPGKDGAPPYYKFDLSEDKFIDPFYDPQRRPRVRLPEPDMQLALDGRATRTTSTYLGPMQQFVLGELAIAPLKAWQVGVRMHHVRMRCNDAPSRRDIKRPLKPGECCYGAVDDGGPMVGSLRDRGLIWKDEAGYWHLYEEEDWAA